MLATQSQFGISKSKLKSLYKLPPRIINIFVKNFNPQEEPSGQGAFRKKQCKYIVQIKNKIRNRYNPRHADLDFHISPLDQGVSHEHVIHASDREETGGLLSKAVRS